MAVPRRVVMGTFFPPRGGSAHVIRNLTRALPKTGWSAMIACASVNCPGHPGNAGEFYCGLSVRELDIGPALVDPIHAASPLPPVYEDRPGPEPYLAELDDAAFERQVAAWEPVLARAGAANADLLHLHHLTPLNEAAVRVAPDVPVIGHLHGTELMFVEKIQNGGPTVPPCAGAWLARIRGWAQRCGRLIVASDGHVQRAAKLLGLSSRRFVTVPNAFDPSVFAPRPLDRAAHWRSFLAAPSPRAARDDNPSRRSYSDMELAAFAPSNPVLLYVGRYAAVKRLPILIEAFARAKPHFHRRAPLVLVGGFPGESEGEHPLDTVRRISVNDVFLAGWRDQHELTACLNASDAIVLPSVHEYFGNALVEGMACGLPAIAADSLGPADIVSPGHTGWLVAPDDVESLAAVLVTVVNDPDERRRRGERALRDVRQRFAVERVARQMADVYQAVLSG